ncbi:unnamed protein product [Linum trigynum]|uniref:Uncharacterized protein n=1 Tax=Linum trigynum TaxID=586398 RepID=A0AAV2GUL1_9ROSI
MANKICEKLGFPNVLRVEAQGRSGGIWLFWNSQNFCVQVVSAGSQHLSVRVSKGNQAPWMLTAVYASPRQQLQRPLWNAIIEQSKQVDCPWILTGDFNSILHPDEKTGPPSPATFRRCKRFGEFLNEAELVDLGFSGPRFTWTRGKESDTYKASRIDRSICNLEWNEGFPNTSVTHLARLSSDHHPILTTVSNQGGSNLSMRRFKFEAAWFTHEDFLSFLADSWDPLNALPMALQDLSKKLQLWNTSNFGNVHQRKKRLVARIEGIERRLANSFSPGLLKLHTKLEKELDKTMEQEELIWFQRAREHWVKFGERNTAYFHQLANIRRRRNKIDCLKNINGEWVSEKDELLQLVYNFFSELYLQDNSPYVDLLPKGDFPRLNQEDWLHVLRPFSILDIHKAVFEMKPLQAPGPDGFQALFYQKAWAVVGKALTDMALFFFEQGTLPEAVTESTVVLIPKVDKPESVTQLRPISLNNVCLKAITKALTCRLKEVMRKLVSPRQSSFIPGRQTTDNILIVQEVLHSLRKKRGKKRGMVLKVDLEKAYDRLRWDFLRDTLIEVGLPSSWIRGIMYCVEHNKMRILWNGELTPIITPTRGVRQGDPLSPYPFVLCMERLSHRIDQAVRDKQWKPIRLSPRGPALSHLFFADDLVLFAEAEGSQIRVVKSCLDEFCASSGQRVSYDKSVLYVSPNIRQDRARRLSDKVAIPLVTNLGRYLGIKAIHGRVTKSRYQALILRIQKKLAPWKARRLSLAARLTVTRSVSPAIPTYSMQSELIPKNVCNAIDKINRDFIWGKEEDKGKLHLVPWEKMTEPRLQGRGGLRPLRQANLALLAKGGWRILKEKEALWTQIFSTKYGKQREGLDIFRPIQGSSFAWRSFTKASHLLRKGCAWNIQNGRSTDFWCDVWVLQVPLRDVAIQPIPEERLRDTVASYLDDNGDWDVDRFSQWLPFDVQQKITAVAVDVFSMENDTLFWAPSPNGHFTAKSAFQIAMPQQGNQDEKLWKKIWSNPVPERVRCFSWLVALNRISTNSMLFYRKCSPSPMCFRCNSCPETTLHLLRDCPPAVYVWSRSVPPSEQLGFFASDQEAWLRGNLLNDEPMANGMPWGAFFSITIWLLWKNRCTTVFQGVQKALTAPSLLHSIQLKADLWYKAWCAPLLETSNREPRRSRVTTSIQWNAPQQGWVKLNIDGASAGNPGPAGAGGLIRDAQGRWIAGFVAKIGEASAALAELWAFYHGLTLALKFGVNNLVIETDSQLAILLISNRHDPVHPYAALLASIRRRLAQDWLVSIVHTYREGNRAADWLSKHSLVYPYGMHELTNPPRELVQILQDDSMGVSFDRRVVAPSSS